MCHLAGYYIKGLFVKRDHEHAKKILDTVYLRHLEDMHVISYLMRAYKLLGDKERCKQCSDKYAVLAKAFNANNPLAD